MSVSISKELIENILLCDPITFRGRKKLRELGLDDSITPYDFWGNQTDPNSSIWVAPTDVCNYRQPRFDASDLIIQYPENYEAERIETRRKSLDARFSGSEGVALIALKGVVGSGKSVEIHRQIYRNYQRIPFQSMVSGVCDPNAILIDLERDVQYVDAPLRYRCADPKQPIHLFLTSSLETLVNYIWKLYTEHTSELAKAKDHLHEFFYRDDVPLRTASNFEHTLVNVISSWASDYKATSKKNVDQWQEICRLIINNLNTKPREDVETRKISEIAAQEDVIQVYMLMFLLSYCTFPHEKKSIIIDNIEDYIAVRSITEQAVNVGIPVSNNQILMIYTALYQTKQRIQEAFEKYSYYIQRRCNRSVTIVMAIRRTTHQLLCNLYMGANEALYDDIFDITGDLDLESIWIKKYQTIWGKYLSEKAGNDSSLGKFMLFANKMILEGDNTIGVPYPQRMMKMLSRGIRRVGHNVSQNLYEAYNLLIAESSSTSRKYITIDQFETILEQRSAARGMLRQALIELYYMGQIGHTHNSQDAVGHRWRFLNLGHLGEKKKDVLFDSNGNKRKGQESAKIDYNEVVYQDGAKTNCFRNNNSYRSMLSRILNVLAERLDMSASQCVAPEYLDMELKSLLSELFPYEPSNSELNCVAQVLIAASSPEREGDYTPYTIMELETQNRLSSQNESDSFANYLRNLWRKPDIPDSHTRDNPASNIIRITEGGFDFLYQWQASYAFYSALYCYNFAPLFFINSKEIIYHILFRVYNNADIMRRFYCKEAVRFAQQSGIEANRDKLDDKYLHNVAGNRMSFDKLLQKLHVDYLALYEQYIKECSEMMGISEEDKKEILTVIGNVRDKYRSDNWNNQVLCF